MISGKLSFTHAHIQHVYRGCSCRKFSRSVTRLSQQLKQQYDACIVGAGHNGLVAAAYLQKAGLNVCVLERRHVIGGAAVTEEIVPGYKFSRASYVLSLLRPQIFNDLELKKHGLKVYLRNPNSYTPILGAEKTSGPKSLILGRDSKENKRQIAQFSTKDAEAFIKYEESLERMVSALDPLLDNQPVRMASWIQSSLTEKWKSRKPLKALLKTTKHLGKDLPEFYEILTAPAIKVLRKWFESEPLIATLATDSVIGAMYSPYTPGSGYVLLHHVMGELEGIKGAWGYAEGGMGAVSQAIANSAVSAGAEIFTSQPVAHIMVDSQKKACGVALKDGREITSKVVLSNATPKVTYLDLLSASDISEDFRKDIEGIDYTSPVTKINVAVDRLPNFLADPNKSENEPMPHHRATIHLNCEDTELVHQAYVDAQQGIPSRKAVIEMTIPSSLDPTIAPPGCHVVQLFTQYTPYNLAGDKEWDKETTNQYADSIFDTIEQYAPGFKASVVGRDVLTPPELERVFGLTGGNIFHGSMSLDQLYTSRPHPDFCHNRSPIPGLYLCGSGAHPGGGVMGSPGRLGAAAALQDMGR